LPIASSSITVIDLGMLELTINVAMDLYIYSVASTNLFYYAFDTIVII